MKDSGRNHFCNYGISINLVEMVVCFLSRLTRFYSHMPGKTPFSQNLKSVVTLNKSFLGKFSKSSLLLQP